MSSQSSSWIPASANASLWHQVRARAEVGGREISGPLRHELERIVDPSIGQIPYLQIPRLAGYLKGVGLDSFEQVEALGSSALGVVVSALAENTELWPLTRGLWQAGREAAAKAAARHVPGDALPRVSHVTETLATTLATHLERTYLERTHLERTTLEERHFYMLLKEAFEWPAVSFNDGVERPASASTIQAWAARQLLAMGDLQTVSAVNDVVDRATRAWVQAAPKGSLSINDSMSTRDAIAASLFTVQPKLCSQAYPVVCLWRWRWLQGAPGRGTPEMAMSAARNLAHVPVAQLLEMGITQSEILAMTVSEDGFARSVGQVLSGETAVRPVPDTRRPPRKERPSATAAWAETAQLRVR